MSALLRFHDAPWYYLLTGADFAPGEEPDYISVAAVIDIADQPFLYVGLLADFYVDADGRLDRLVLQNVIRRPFARDKDPRAIDDDDDLDRFYTVEGDYFVVRYAETRTLNLKYIKLEAPRPDP